jgi:hypothetical protein
MCENIQTGILEWMASRGFKETNVRIWVYYIMEKQAI